MPRPEGRSRSSARTTGRTSDSSATDTVSPWVRRVSSSTKVGMPGACRYAFVTSSLTTSSAGSTSPFRPQDGSNARTTPRAAAGPAVLAGMSINARRCGKSCPIPGRHAFGHHCGGTVVVNPPRVPGRRRGITDVLVAESDNAVRRDRAHRCWQVFSPANLSISATGPRVRLLVVARHLPRRTGRRSRAASVAHRDIQPPRGTWISQFLRADVDLTLPAVARCAHTHGPPRRGIGSDPAAGPKRSMRVAVR